jgi:hypothetical protein
MNISQSESEPFVVAKTCSLNAGRRVAYTFIDQVHSLCLDNKDIIRAEIDACKKLSKYAVEKADKMAVEKELSELQMALDLLS